MVGKTIGLSSEFIIHPGETLKEVLEDKNFTQKELALRTGFSEKHISKVLSGDSNISPSFAKQLEYVFNNIPSSFWNNLQRMYDEEITEFETQANITMEEKKVAKLFEPYLTIENIKWSTEIEKVLYLRRYMEVSNLVNVNKLVQGNYRTHFESKVDDYTKYGFNMYSLHAVSTIENDTPLDIKGLIESIPTLKSIMMGDVKNYVSLLQNELKKYGVLFNLVKKIPGTKIKGYTTSNRKGQAVLIITDHGKYWHYFWFTLFHEIHHIINKDFLKKNLSDEELRNIEKSANLFAEDILIDRQAFKVLVSKRDFKLSTLDKFAQEQQVNIDTVIGRLQKYNYLNHYEYNDLIRKITIFEKDDVKCI